MKILYREDYNYNVGLLGRLHPFDMNKFRKVANAIEKETGVTIGFPAEPVDEDAIDRTLNFLGQGMVRSRSWVLNGLEVPRIPFLTFNRIDKLVLKPMRWGVAGTLMAAREALSDRFCWNLSGGFHHASQQMLQGFCIYNDIAITYEALMASSELTADDKILIVDTDAHHGNGNAQYFMDNPNVVLCDIYNEAIYPLTSSTRDRVDYAVPLQPSTTGPEYLSRLNAVLSQIPGGFKLAFVVAGTDVLQSDRLGKLGLRPEDIPQRERMTISALLKKAQGVVMTTGGGYSEDSAPAIADAILACRDLVSA